MASFEVIPSAESLSSGDFSLLADARRDHPSENGLMNGIDFNPDLTNLPSTLSNMLPDPGEDYIHSKMQSLNVANQSLKGALIHTNKLMKDQMVTVCEWRNQMMRALREAKESLDNAEEKISVLENEKVDLLQKLDVVMQKCKELEEQKPCEKCETLEPVMEKVKEELDSVETVKNILIGQLTEKNCSEEMICQNLSTILAYLMNLMQNRRISKKDKHKIFSVIQALNDQVVSLGGDCHTNEQTDEEAGYVVINRNNQAIAGPLLQETQEIEKMKKAVDEMVADTTLQKAEEIENMQKAMDEKDEIIDCLRKQSLELSEKLKAYEKRLQQYENDQKNNFDMLVNKLKIAQQLSEKYKERYESVQEQLDKNQSKLEEVKIPDANVVQLCEEKKSLQDILKLEQCDKQQLQEKLNEVKIQCEKLQVDFDRVTQLLEIQSKDAKKKEKEQNSATESQMKELKIKHHLEEMELKTRLDHITAHLVETRQQLDQMKEELNQKNVEVNQKNLEVNDLTKQVVTLTEEKEMLREQVHYFRADIEEAVATRNTAHEEITRLETEIKLLKSGSNSASSRRSSAHRQEAREVTLITCPICGRKFDSLHEAETHIEETHPESSKE